MRYRLPEGCAGVSHAGVALASIAEDGVIEAEAALAEHLAPHGIVPIEDRSATEMPRPAVTKKRTKP